MNTCEADIIVKLQGIANGFWDVFFKIATVFGETGMVFIVMAVLLLTCGARIAGKYGITAAAATVAGQVIKFIVQRPRPYEFSDDITAKTAANGFSFISGHTLAATVTAAFLFLLALERMRGKPLKVLLGILLTLAALTVGFSRVYLGVHYITDVVGGFVLGIGLTLFCWWLFDEILRSYGYCFNLKDTRIMAKRFAKTTRTGLVTLGGEMGAGKTTFVAAVTAHLTTAAVTSPTFTIINQYAENIYHADLYRLTDPHELENTGFYELTAAAPTTSPNLVFVEWADRIDFSKVNVPIIRVKIDILGKMSRRITWDK